MRILVTGGAGYIGSHTCVELINKGMDVVCIDNFVNYRVKAIERVEQITGGHIDFYENDVHDRAALDRIFEKHEDSRGVPNNLMPYISQVTIGRRDHLSIFGDDYETPDGTGVRDYIHVVDLARGHVAAIEYMQDHKGESTFNLGTGHGYSVLDMVKAFERMTGVKIPYEIAPRRPGDLTTVYSSPDKSAELLGWKAECNLDDMCRDTWAWQSKNPMGYAE